MIYWDINPIELIVHKTSGPVNCNFSVPPFEVVVNKFNAVGILNQVPEKELQIIIFKEVWPYLHCLN